MRVLGAPRLPFVYCPSRMTLFVVVVCLFEPTAVSLAICYIRFPFFFLSFVVIIGGVHSYFCA